MEVVLIRHGEPTYDEVAKWGKIGLGFELGKLSRLGVQQAHEVSKDERLIGASLIISSPYTRALHTAAIISKNINIDLEVETELHEWFADTNFIFDYEVDDSYKAYIKSRGIIDNEQTLRFETYELIKNRVAKVLEQYSHLDKIIVVCHGIVMTAFDNFDELFPHCGIKVITI